eukprot:1176647-Prorocentrum_minimum.AAC.3
MLSVLCCYLLGPHGSIATREGMIFARCRCRTATLGSVLRPQRTATPGAYLFLTVMPAALAPHDVLVLSDHVVVIVVVIVMPIGGARVIVNAVRRPPARERCCTARVTAVVVLFADG